MSSEPLGPTFGARSAPAFVLRAFRYWQCWLAGTVLVVVLWRMAWDNGGYFPDSYLSSGIVTFTALAFMLALRPPRFTVSTGGLIALASLAAFTAWSALSSNWSPAHGDAVAAMQRDLVHTGLFALALIAVGSGRYARHVVWVTFALIVLVVGGALLSRLYPRLVPSPSLAKGSSDFRLSYPFGYQNALGALGAMGVVLAVGFASDVRTRVPLRALSGGLAVALATTTYLTISRGAAIALAVGLVVLVVLTVRHGSLLLTGAVIALGSAIAIARLQSFTALTDNPLAAPGQTAAGRSYGRELIAIIAAVIAANGLIALGRRSQVLMGLIHRGRVPLRLLAAALGSAVLLIGLAQAGTAADFTSRQWDIFWSATSQTTPQTHGVQRLASLSSSRSDVFRVAWRGFTAHPLIGDGVAGFRDRWLRERPIYANVRNAHSLELETLAEEGLIGFSLLALFVGAVIVAAVRARLSPLGLGRSQAAAVSGACAVWLVHSAVDWDWQVTALTGVAFTLAATLLPARRDRLGTDTAEGKSTERDAGSMGAYDRVDHPTPTPIR